MPKPFLFDFQKVLDSAQRWLFIPLVTCIFVLLTAWSIDSLRPQFGRIGLKDLDIPEVVGITLAATMFVLTAFQHDLKVMRKQLSSFSPVLSSRIVLRGVQDVYVELGKAINAIGNHGNSERTLEVLGLTLFTAWPVFLEPALANDDQMLRGWTINLFLLSPVYIKQNHFLNERWVLDSEAQTSAIRDFARRKAQSLQTNHIKLSVSQYACFPAIHGFRTSAGHLFISYIQWDGNHLDRPIHFYEVFQPSDTSARAVCYRALFENWIRHARANSTEVPCSKSAGFLADHHRPC